MKQDDILKKILKFFLNYGLSFQKNIFQNFFWYKNIKNTNIKFFRKYFYSNDLLNIEHSFSLRLNSGEYFPLKLWILKYNNWLILSYLWFKPVKYKNFNKTLSGKNFTHNLLPSFHIDKNFRTKFLVYFFFKKINKISNKYLF